MESQPCKHLRTKRLYIPELAINAFARSATGEPLCQCWCNKTMMEVGLDDRHVSLQACTDADRPCYRAR
jgi:hypothetical protein